MTIDAQEFLRAARERPQPIGDVAKFRAALANYLRFAGDRREDVVVDELHPAGVPRMRVYRPAALPPRLAAPGLVYLHGGAWVRGTLDAAEVVCRELAARTPAVVFSVDYRLSPEHPYPAALDDARAALDWVIAQAAAHGVDPARLAVGGDSAGANLATVVARQHPDTIGLQVLLSGLYDLTEKLPVAGAAARVVDIAAEQRRLDWIVGCYAPAPEDVADPHLSPLRNTDFAALPPTVLISSGWDPFVEQNRRYARLLTEAGVDVRYHEYARAPHAFTNLGAVFPEAYEVYDAVAHALRTFRPPQPGVSAADAPAGRSRRPYDSEARKQALLSAGRELFGERGYAKTTIRAIGERAGVDPALISRYFGNKDGLYLAAIASDDTIRQPDVEDLSDVETIAETLLHRVVTRQGVGPVALALLDPMASADARDRAREVVDKLTAPLVERLTDAGTDDAAVRSALAVACMAGISAVYANGSLPALTGTDVPAILELLGPALRALTDTDPGPGSADRTAD
ncbi:alpha/beta hydrolase fold domain-containing protein [Nocardia sp. NPDC046763]|uniref:alpha/beta hydrolase fold domain-containing protein n=1 Tax=Nocardia sp. NPDC046763 TaxID=3155256 RepID=UPI0033E295BD